MRGHGAFWGKLTFVLAALPASCSSFSEVPQTKHTHPARRVALRPPPFWGNPQCLRRRRVDNWVVARKINFPCPHLSSPLTRHNPSGIGTAGAVFVSVCVGVVVRTRSPPKCGVEEEPGYRPSMGVTSSMLLGLEYAAGLRDGNGRSALVP